MKFLIFHDTFDYSVRIVAGHENDDVFRVKMFDTWNVRAIGKKWVGVRSWNDGNSLIFIVVVSFLCPPSI